MVIDRGIKHELVLDTNFRIIGCRAGTIYCKSAMSICGEWEVNRLRQSCDNPARTCVSLSHDLWNQPRRITRYYWLTFSFFLIFTIFQTLYHAMETLNILRCLEIESWQNFAKIRIWNWRILEFENLKLR